MSQLITDLIAQFHGYYEEFVVIFPRLILAIIVFTVLLFLANRSRNYTREKLSRKMDDPLLAKFIARLVKMTLVMVSIMIVLKIIGLTDIATGLITGASVSAIVVGFAFKDIGENFLAGIMLAFDRPFKVGDVVELDGHKGQVVTLNLRNSQIKTFDGKDIFIPNANVIKNSVVNYTIDGYQRHDFDIGLDYGSDVGKAIMIMLSELKSIEGILSEDKAPSVHATSLGASTLNLTAYYWLDTFDKNVSSSHIKTQAIDQILIALANANFNLPGDVVEIKNYQNANFSMKQG